MCFLHVRSQFVVRQMHFGDIKILSPAFLDISFVFLYLSYLHADTVEHSWGREEKKVYY